MISNIKCMYLYMHINKHHHQNYHNNVLCCMNIYITYIISYYSTSCCLVILPPPRMPVANAGLVRDPQASPHLVTLDGIYRQVEGGQRCSAWLKPQLLSSFPSEIRRVKYHGKVADVSVAMLHCRESTEWLPTFYQSQHAFVKHGK